MYATSTRNPITKSEKNEHTFSPFQSKPTHHSGFECIHDGRNYLSVNRDAQYCSMQLQCNSLHLNDNSTYASFV